MVVVEESLNQTLNLGNSLVIFLGVVTAILAIYHFWFQSLRYTKLGNKIPGYDPIPIIGNAHLALNKSPTEIMEFALRIVKEKGSIVRFWFGSKLGVALLDPRDIELVLGSNVHLEKSSEYSFFEPWLGDGLLISKGDKWRSHRKMIAPTFHQSILKTFIPVFNKNAASLIDQLRNEALDQICDIHDYMSGTTVDVLLETVMGVKKTKEATSSYKYAKAVMDMCTILHFRHVRIWLRPDWIFSLTKMFKEQNSLLRIIHNLTDRVIKQKKRAYFERVKEGDVSLYNNAVKETEEENLRVKNEQTFNYGSALRDDLDENDENLGEKKRLAFLDFMVEASQTEGNKLNDEEIREEVNTIMFEGHDTTAAASSFFVCVLGCYPEIQEKVYQELREIFQGSDRPITFNDTLEMKYLERVLLETLRMYPPVPIITRVINEEIKLASADYTLPIGTTVGIGQFLVHRNPKYYPNPDKFDPDNFLPERCQQRHYYSFIPFSAGPRSCVGRKYAMLKLKILLASIVRNFKIKSVVSEKDFQLQADIILKRADGFRVILSSRT
uniref:CYP4G7 n=1 Tax=Tribolium confusum TaxID=7071 RepID=A0A7D6EMA5_TRICF|nr:cytochrome P450 [Tribolium confusum]UXX17146.1 CYP4G7 [Tribolium confusum]